MYSDKLKTRKIINSLSSIPQVDNNDLFKVNFESKSIKKQKLFSRVALSTIIALIICTAIVLPIVLTQGVPSNHVAPPNYYKEIDLSLRAIDQITDKKILMPNQNLNTFELYNYENVHIGYKLISNQSIHNYENVNIVITEAEHIIEDDNYKVMLENTRFKCAKVYYNEIQFENSFAYYISFFKNEHNYRVSFESSEPVNVKKALQHIF